MVGTNPLSILSQTSSFICLVFSLIALNLKDLSYLDCAIIATSCAELDLLFKIVLATVERCFIVQ